MIFNTDRWRADGGMGSFRGHPFWRIEFHRIAFSTKTVSILIWNNPFHFRCAVVKRILFSGRIKERGFWYCFHDVIHSSDARFFERQRITAKCYSTRSFNNARSVSGRTNMMSMSHFMYARPIAITMMNYVSVCVQKNEKWCTLRREINKILAFHTPEPYTTFTWHKD